MRASNHGRSHLSWNHLPLGSVRGNVDSLLCRAADALNHSVTSANLNNKYPHGICFNKVSDIKTIPLLWVTIPHVQKIRVSTLHVQKNLEINAQCTGVFVLGPCVCVTSRLDADEEEEWVRGDD